MKKLFLLMLWAAMAVGAQAQYAKLHEVKASSIAPEGWIKEYLVRQQNGMTGNVTMQGFPYTSNMWHGVIPNNNSWWPYEQTGYYLDGSYKLGVLLNDPSLSKHFKDNLEWVISHPDKDGMLGATFSTQASLWPYAVFFKAFIAYYMETGDKEALEVFHKFYTDAVSTETLGIGERNHTNIEAVLKIYEWTHDKAMLDKAVKAYDLADKHRVSSDLGFSMMKTDNKLVNHGVTFCESVKIPVMLYMYTGNREYLDVAEHSIEMIERDQIGPSGVPSCNECMMTKDPMQSHETCVTADRAGEAYLAVNSKDAAAVWLNGKLVHTVKGPNDVAHHMPDLVKVKLRKGANNVMMKVGRYGSSNQYADGWGAKLQCVRKADK